MTTTRPKEDHEIHTDRMWRIRSKMYDLLEFGHGSVEWIAMQQKDRETREYWGQCCVLRGVFEFDKSTHKDYVDFFVPKEDFDTQTDDQLAQEFAEHILGYPIGSQQDIERKKRYVMERIDECNKELERVMDKRRMWKSRLRALNGANHD